MVSLTNIADIKTTGITHLSANESLLQLSTVTPTLSYKLKKAESLASIEDIVGHAKSDAVSLSDQIFDMLNVSITLPYQQSTGESLPLFGADNGGVSNIILNSTVKNNSVDNHLTNESFFNELKTVLRRHPMALMIAVTYVT
jgi:hypothetical protein